MTTAKATKAELEALWIAADLAILRHDVAAAYKAVEALSVQCDMHHNPCLDMLPVITTAGFWPQGLVDRVEGINAAVELSRW